MIAALSLLATLARHRCVWGVVKALVAICSLLPASFAWAQASREFEIKAAYLYQFGRYFECPPTAFGDAKAPFVIAVVGTDQIDDLLKTATQGKLLQNRPIVVRRYDRVENAGDCNILFISDTLDDKVEAQLCAKYAKSPTILVGEGESFLARGGTISFLIAENKVKIRLSKKAAMRLGLKPSSKLLQVAEVLD